MFRNPTLGVRVWVSWPVDAYVAIPICPSRFTGRGVIVVALAPPPSVMNLTPTPSEGRALTVRNSATWRVRGRHSLDASVRPTQALHPCGPVTALPSTRARVNPLVAAKVCVGLATDMPVLGASVKGDVCLLAAAALTVTERYFLVRHSVCKDYSEPQRNQCRLESLEQCIEPFGWRIQVH
jgi:hypothetical protein